MGINFYQNSTVFFSNGHLAAMDAFKRDYVYYIFFGKNKLQAYPTEYFPSTFAIPDIGMDCYKTTKTADKLGSSGLGPCFAICSKGKDLSGRVVLGMCHMSHLIDFQEALEILKNQMIKDGCIQKSIETIVIGGKKPDPNNDNYPGTSAEEQRVVELAQEQNISAAIFNPVEEQESSVDVLMTKDGVFISKNDIFKSTH